MKNYILMFVSKNIKTIISLSLSKDIKIVIELNLMSTHKDTKKLYFYIYTKGRTKNYTIIFLCLYPRT